MYIALTLIAILFAALRIGGVKTQSFQAFAHLFVGGLFGAAWVGFVWSVGADAVFWVSLAIALSLVELTAFLIGFFKPMFHGLG